MSIPSAHRRIGLAVLGWLLLAACAPTQAGDRCFLLQEVGAPAPVSSNPVCRERYTPASTFKIPHALIALDAGVIANADAVLRYDGKPDVPPSWKRDHTLATAIPHSVVWYFQQLAQRLGMARERDYLQRLHYGNADPSSGLTTFWLGGSLLISPQEQLAFMARLYRDDLPIQRQAMQAVRGILVQPEGKVMNALGEHDFAAPWPSGTVLSAKTGSATDAKGRSVRWLVGHVARGARQWLFVACAVGGPELAPDAAIELAAKELSAAKVLGP